VKSRTARALAAALALGGLLLALTACNGSQAESQVETADVVQQVPWGTNETARYRILRGGEVTGSATLTVAREGGVFTVRQEFRDARERFRDVVTATVDAATLKPRAVERVLTGPEGERRCRAEYEGGRVRVHQESDDESRTDELVVPAHAYDSWTDIFLWRTMGLDRGASFAYWDIGTCILSKPGSAIMQVTVVTKEFVTVPGGGFDAWRLEARSDGQRHLIWIADTPQRPVVRYDNGTHLFELQELR
jgi:hypothetical protein